jgi:hypothetical protein
MPQPGRRRDRRSGASELCREATDHHRPQRDAVHDIGALGAHDLQRLEKIAQATQRTETAAPALDRNHGKPFRLEPLATATCKPQSRAACAIGKKCETKNQSSVTR